MVRFVGVNRVLGSLGGPVGQCGPGGSGDPGGQYDLGGQICQGVYRVLG